jgi:hypothetical protein
MLTIYEPPRQYAVQRETEDGGRVRVGLYDSQTEAMQAVARSIARTGVPAEKHSIFWAAWSAVLFEEWNGEVQRMVAENDPIMHDEDEVNDIEGSQH